MTAILDQLKTLPVLERLKLIGNLWDSIEDDSGELSLTDDQVKVLERRSAELDANPFSAIPWDDAKRRLLEKCQ